MSRRLFPHSLLRNIFEEAREIQMLTSPHQPSPTSEIRTISPLHLPDIRAPAQYLIDMGLRPALAQRISGVYMDFIARYRQVLDSHFCRVIHGGCHLRPEYYRDIFVVQFKDTIQVWESRIMSITLAWLCRVGQPPAPPCPQSINVRVDSATKTQILSRLGLKTTTFIENKRANIVKLTEACETEGDSSPSMKLSISPPHTLRSMTVPSTRDPFSSETPSTCFPACYPPPPREPTSSPRKTMATQFTTSKNTKPRANCSIDTSSLINLFGCMSVTTFEVGLKAQENRKCVWAPRSKKPEPLSAILTPVIASVSGSLPKLQSLDTVTVSSAKPITVPRRRRIAALPMRHNKTTALPISDPSSSAVSPPVSAPTSNNATPHAQFSRVARMTVTEETPNNITSSAVTSQYGTSPRAQYTTGTSDTVESKSILSERRKKRLPLPRRVAFQLQATQSQRQRRTPTPEAPEQSTLFSTVSRTPSLVSDTSSYADSSSSSDEFDTPPSTPPSNSDGLTSHNGLVESDDSPSKFNTTKPVGLPILANAGFPDPRKGEGTRFGFTNGNAVAERQLSFTFGA